MSILRSVSMTGASGGFRGRPVWSIRRPTGVEARLSIKGGIGKPAFDDQRSDVAGGRVRLQGPGYDIETSGGASAVEIR